VSFSCFCAPGLVFGGAGGDGSLFKFLRSRTRFRLYRGRPAFMFCIPDSFSTVPWASSPVFLFFSPGLVFGDTEGVESRFHFLRSQTRFRRYRGRRVPFSCFALPYSFSAMMRESGPVFTFCAPELIFGGTRGAAYYLIVLSAQTHFRRFRRRRVPFSCFARPNSFSTVPRESGPVFNFCAPRLVFGGTEGVWSRFHVSRARTHFRRNGGLRVPFSCFALTDSFWAVPMASLPVFMFFGPGHLFGGTEGAGYLFHVLRSPSRFRRYGGRRVLFSCIVLPDSFWAVARASLPVFMFCAPEFVFGGTEGVGSRFHVLLSRTRFGRYRGRRVPFSCFCATGLVFGGSAEGVGSLFKFLRSRTRFWLYRGRPVFIFCTPDSF
jgi:hypothetical protein